MFLSPSTAGRRDLLDRPMVPHVDHTEHDTQVIVTEQGLADLRGLSPRRRGDVIDNCAHPEFREALHDYLAARRRGVRAGTPRTCSARRSRSTSATCGSGTMRKV